ncbi:Polygalacturonase inhibitor protein [Rhynchospora pubera]|uniref:Polygalacturonase inhibitor protein n=1 Tax=Rhynchospora pubera TaxID=906938 RepID=A0AAV8FNK9_9POAL|nr:Polygalacturonase inhibitor protein [Rhynchospora pubera]
MSVILFLAFFLYCTSSALSTKDDETALLKINKQLGNPDILQSWVKGFDFCNAAEKMAFQHNWYIRCSSTGRVIDLYLQNTDFTVPFPNAICDLTELEFVGFYHSPWLYGSIPSCITQLYNLHQIVIVGTSLSGSVPSFYNHPNLTIINLSLNHLSGTIPSSFSTLPNLIQLDLSFNYLTGTIPPQLVHTSHTSYPQLVLANNSLTGELPRCYGWIDFGLIDLGNNQLSGDASFLFGKQKKSFAKIILANKEFEFDLSYVEFSDNLYGFDLSHNKIYGKVPDSFATASVLLDPNLSFNKLCGELPQGGSMGRFNAAVFANNTCLCGYPLPPCSASAPASSP